MIQIDMLMPKCCSECPFTNANFYSGIMSLSCITPTGRLIYDPDLIYRKDRPAWCPLKEQESVEPIVMDHIVFGTNRKCSKCNQALFPAGKYCPHCGQAVKWNG